MSDSDDEITVHWLSWHQDHPRSMVTGCGAPFAQIIRGQLWVKNLVTTDLKLVTCERCAESPGWERIHRRLLSLESGPWRVEAGCILSSEGRVLALAPESSLNVTAMAAAAEMVEVLRDLAAGRIEEARTRAAQLLEPLRSGAELYAETLAKRRTVK